MAEFIAGTYIEGGYKHRVEVEVDLTGVGEDATLAVTTSTYRRARNGRWMDEGGGATREPLRLVTSPAQGLTREALDKLADVGDRWHLNYMKPGCSHQREAGWSERPIDPSKPTRAYGKHFPGQQSDSWNMLGWVRPSEHPEGLLGKECEECGYAYGTAWLKEPIAEDVQSFVREMLVAQTGGVAV